MVNEHVAQPDSSVILLLCSNGNELQTNWMSKWVQQQQPTTTPTKSTCRATEFLFGFFGNNKPNNGSHQHTYQIDAWIKFSFTFLIMVIIMTGNQLLLLVTVAQQYSHQDWYTQWEIIIGSIFTEWNKRNRFDKGTPHTPHIHVTQLYYNKTVRNAVFSMHTIRRVLWPIR